jgi:hypothetical protein
VATAATFNPTQQTAKNTATPVATPNSGGPGSHNRTGRLHHWLMDPSGM